MEAEPSVSTIIDTTPTSIKRSLPPVFVVIIVFVVLLTLVLLFLFIQPAVKNEKVFVSNISEKQATLSWVTKTPAAEWVLVTEQDNRFARVFKDDKETFFLPVKASNLHYVTFANLDPNKTYKYKIYQNLKEVSSGTFATAPQSAGAKTIKIVSGQVLSADQKTPASGVIVYLQLLEGAQQSTLLSTVTDQQGKWQANILGAQTADLKNDFKIASKSAGLVVVESGSGRFSTRFAVSNNTKSVPDIILKEAK